METVEVDMTRWKPQRNREYADKPPSKAYWNNYNLQRDLAIKNRLRDEQDDTARRRFLANMLDTNRITEQEYAAYVRAFCI